MRKPLLCIVSVLCACLLMCPSVLAETTVSEVSEEPTVALTAGETAVTADADSEASDEAESGASSLSDSVSMPASAFSAFTYDCWGDTVRCPDPYSLIRKVGATSWGLNDIKKVKDVYADSEGYVYLSINGDTEKDNALLRFDRELNLVNAWYGYLDNGKFVRFTKPDGIFVTDAGEIFVADTQTRNVYHFTVNSKNMLDLVMTIDAPSTEDSAIIDKDFVERYIPAKVVVDHTDRVYVVATNVNEGIVAFTEDGKFDGFLAAGKVTVDPFTKFMKKYIYTAEQKARIQTFVPISYNNIDLDQEGFIFTTLAASKEATVLSEIKSKKGTEEGALVRRLNMMGSDILKRDGYEPPVGDTDILDTVENADATYKGLSQITDVSCGAYGTYTLLDNNRNHIFVYNNEGYLLYAFNGPDTTAGGMKTPIALAQNGDYMYVLDSDSRSIFLFKQTEFAGSVMQAIELEKNGKYSAASEAWNHVLELNATYDLAYLGLGKTAYWNGDYEGALDLFKLCNNQTWYSKAWAETRKDVLAKWFMPIVLTILGLIALGVLLKFVKKARTKKRKEADEG